MIVKVTLTADDFLTYMLYAASKNKLGRRKRIQSWLIITAVFFAAAFLFRDNKPSLVFWFVFFGIVTFCFYPLYQRYSYKKHYKKFLVNNLQQRVAGETIIIFQQGFIETKDSTGESKINTSEVFEICEIGTHYFVRLITGDGLVIPKSAVGSDDFINELLEIFQNPQIEVNKELSWKWR